MDRAYTHLVIIIRDTDPPEVTGFNTLEDALPFFDQWGAQWSNSFLAQIVYGPGKPFRGTLPPVGARTQPKGLELGVRMAPQTECAHCGHSPAAHGCPVRGITRGTECNECSCARWLWNEDAEIPDGVTDPDATIQCATFDTSHIPSDVRDRMTADRAAAQPLSRQQLAAARDIIDRNSRRFEQEGARSPTPTSPVWCPECGPVEKLDDDGCCSMCGATIVSERVLSQIIDFPTKCEQEAHELKILGARALIKRLRGTISGLQAAAERRNRALDALHWVWCSGGCESGVHRFCGHPDEITEDVVATVERQAKRLREWYTTRQAKKEGQQP